MIPTLQPPPRWWKCPSCETVDRTFDPDPGSVQFHHCPAFSGAAIPLVEVKDFDSKLDVKRVVEKAEDYIAGERDNPVTGLHTYYPTGRQDAHVFAPVAVTKATGLDSNGPPAPAGPTRSTFYCFY
jgi:hypothetical protein